MKHLVTVCVRVYCTGEADNAIDAVQKAYAQAEQLSDKAFYDDAKIVSHTRVREPLAPRD